MTGFASTSREDAGQKVTVTAKSVNHRFLDLAIKAPQALAAIESAAARARAAAADARPRRAVGDARRRRRRRPARSC